MNNFINDLQPYFPLLVIAVGGLIYQFYFNDHEDHSYGADFGSTKGILSRWNKGLAITTKKYLTQKQSFENFLAIGGTGSGKGVNIVIPTLDNLSNGKYNASIIVNDPSGETRRKTTHLLLERGYEILVINFANPGESIKWNPITLATTDSEINKITSILSRSTLKESKDPFWSIQGNNLISCMIRIIKTQAPEFQNLYNVRHLIKVLNYDPESVDKLFSEFADEKLLADYKSFITLSPKMLTSITSTSLAALSLFDDPGIACITGSDSFDFDILRKRKICLFIQNRIAEQSYYAPLVNTLVTQLFSHTMSRLPRKGDRPIFYLIDEAGSLYFPQLSETLANIRKHKAGIALLCQNYAQLENIYGAANAKAIRSNCLSRLYFKGQSLNSAKDLEVMLGKFEYEDEDGKKRVRHLMASDEIRMIPKDRALFFCDNHQPMYVKLKPYYKSWRLRRLCDVEPPEIANQLSSEPPPLLPL